VRKAIVTTTINSPTEATKKFCEIARNKGWTFVIVGDTKTPHEEYEKLQKLYYPSVLYLDPDFQDILCPELSKVIGWKTIQRRNVGFVYAYRVLKADIVATVDDDNIPYEDWGDDCYVGQEIEVDCYQPRLGFVCDPLSVTNQSHLWHRGYPINWLDHRETEYIGKIRRKVLIQADFWDGDPDIDAIARLTQKPIVKFNHTKPFAFERKGCITLSPFNSQNTFLDRSIIPYYAVLPYVGRMDDIWGGYITQYYFKDSIIYNRASVYQDRNKQDLIKNLENEIIGYRNTFDFIGDVLKADIGKVVGDPKEWIENNTILPKETKEFWKIYRKQF
jgi:hypothetical protein